MLPNNAVVFNAKQTKDDLLTDHNLVFIKRDNVLCMGYARPRPNTPDKYNHKFGVCQATEIAEKILNRDTLLRGAKKKPRKTVSIEEMLKDKGREYTAENVGHILSQVMPRTIVNTLLYYIGKAKRIFKIDGQAIVQFRGDKRDNRVFEIKV